MRNGTKHLRIASVIQIVLGLLGILFVRFLLDRGDVSSAGMEGKTALALLIVTYAGYFFQIFAGIMGLLLANKKSLFTVILGILLYIPSLITFLHADNNMTIIIINAILLIIPYYYLHSAYKNFKE